MGPRSRTSGGRCGKYGPFVHAVTGSPWSFGPRPSYRVRTNRRGRNDPAASWQLPGPAVSRGFGPAAVEDCGQFGLLNRPPLREAFDSLELTNEIVPAGTHGKRTLSTSPDRDLPHEDTPAPAAADGDVGQRALRLRGARPDHPPRTAPARDPSQRRVLPTLLVDGYVGGVWRPIGRRHRGNRAPAAHRRSVARARRGGAIPAVASWPVANRGVSTLRALVAHAPRGEVRVLGRD